MHFDLVRKLKTELWHVHKMHQLNEAADYLFHSITVFAKETY